MIEAIAYIAVLDLFDYGFACLVLIGLIWLIGLGVAEKLNASREAASGIFWHWLDDHAVLFVIFLFVGVAGSMVITAIRFYYALFG